MTQRAALYARYSSDRQNALSVADQLDALMRHAKVQGLEVVATFSDAAISGAAMANRPGLLAAIAAAERREYDVLLTEDEDRIARNLEHLAHVANRLRAVGAHIATFSTARVETMHVAFKGLIAEDYLRNLSLKTRRGVRANAERGLATGGALYGYESKPGGETTIVEAEAEVIRAVFAAYVEGKTLREIAAQLNLQRIPGPRGGMWNASTLGGSRTRGNGILRTEVYAGVKVWNRMEVVKDTFTGKRTPRMKPETEWKRTAVPHLAIVDEATWKAAEVRHQAEVRVRPEQLARRKTGIFSGLLKCGLCGGSYTSMSRDRLVCSANRERGDVACGNRRSLSRREVELRVLVGLQERLLTPELAAVYVQTYLDQWRKDRAAEIDRRAPITRRLAEITRAEARTLEAIERGVATAAMERRMMEREAERVQLEAELAVMGQPEPVVELHPAAVHGFAEKVARLHQALTEAALNARSDALDAELVASLRELIEKIELKPLLNTRGAPYEVNLHGRLNLFLRDWRTEQSPNRYGGALVAGGGIEPPTCGL